MRKTIILVTLKKAVNDARQNGGPGFRRLTWRLNF